MLQMRLAYALVDLHPLRPAPQVTSPPQYPIARRNDARASVQNGHCNPA